jgi:O-antigen/teichoic acid export membrane protein
VVVAVSLPLAVVVHVQRGVLQGIERFGRFALSTAIEAAIKVATAVALVAWIWPTVAGALLGLIAGLGVTLVANALLMRFLPAGASVAGRQLRHPYRYSLATLATLSLLALLLSLDVVAAKRYLPADEAGLYAAIALAGKVVFFATSGINWVVFPRFSRLVDSGQDPRRLLGRTFALIASVALLICASYLVAADVVIGTLFGDRYPQAGRYLPWIAAGYGGYCIAYLGSTYLLALRTNAGIAALGLALVTQLVGFATLHDTVGELVSVQAVALTAGAALVALVCLFGGQTVGAASLRGAPLADG